MGLGLRESRLRERRLRWRRRAKFLVMLAVLVGLGVFAYRTGSVIAEREVRLLREEIGRLTRTVETLRAENSSYRVATETAKLKEAEWRKRYEADAPTGTRKELLGVVDRQLAAGANVERLKFMMEAAADQTKCSGQPATKRFLVRTPISIGPVSSAGFAEGALLVTAEGASATDEAGRAVAWFDPAQPVVVRFAAVSGRQSKAEGKLPLQHSMIVNDAEYRFNIVEGERRGFIHATADRCDLPGKP